MISNLDSEKKKRKNYSNQYSHHTIKSHKRNNKELHIIWIDLKKAYDSVEHWALETAMRMMGLQENFIELVKNIYTNNIISFITNHGLTPEMNMTSGVRQRDGLSPLLFIIFMNSVLDY